MAPPTRGYSSISNNNSNNNTNSHSHSHSQDSDDDSSDEEPNPNSNNRSFKSKSKSFCSTLFSPKRRLICLSLSLFVIYLITVPSLLSLYSSSKNQDHNLALTKLKLNDAYSLLQRFNHTVTNADLERQVSDLKEQVRSQIRDVNDALDQQTADVNKALDKTVSQIELTVDKAQKDISSEVNQVKHTIDQYKTETTVKFSQENNFMLYQLAGTFTLLGFLISLWHVSSHIRNFNNPLVQRKILAILWMAPIYSMTAWLSLVFASLEGYLSIIKDCYEAYVVYVFLSFLISVLGNGDRAEVVKKLSKHASHLKLPFGCGCFFRDAKNNDRSLANAVLFQCQLFGLQFVVLKPFLAIATFTLTKTHYFPPPNGTFDFRSPQIYILVLQNFSVMLAFSGLLKFYHAIQTDLLWCKPWPKFLCIKGVVFMTFWQGLAINILAKSSETSENSAGEGVEWGKQAQSFLICIEMLIASIAHIYVFPHNEWADGYIPQTRKKTRFGDNLALRDFFSDLKVIMKGDKEGTAKIEAAERAAKEAESEHENEHEGGQNETESEGEMYSDLDLDLEDATETSGLLEERASFAKVIEKVNKIESGDEAIESLVIARIAMLEASFDWTVKEDGTLTPPTLKGNLPLPPLSGASSSASSSKKGHFRPRNSRIHR